MPKVQVKLKFQRETMDALRKRGLEVEPVRFCKGDHLILNVTNAEGQTVRTTLSGTPSGYATHSVLGAVSKAFSKLKADTQ